MSTGAQAINRSMSQLGYDPHCYNPVILSMPNQWVRSSACLLKQGPINLSQ